VPTTAIRKKAMQQMTSAKKPLEYTALHSTSEAPETPTPLASPPAMHACRPLLMDEQLPRMSGQQPASPQLEQTVDGMMNGRGGCDTVSRLTLSCHE
jgi:hypothetical protein